MDKDLKDYLAKFPPAKVDQTFLDELRKAGIRATEAIAKIRKRNAAFAKCVCPCHHPRLHAQPSFLVEEADTEIQDGREVLVIRKAQLTGLSLV